MTWTEFKCLALILSVKKKVVIVSEGRNSAILARSLNIGKIFVTEYHPSGKGISQHVVLLSAAPWSSVSKHFVHGIEIVLPSRD